LLFFLSPTCPVCKTLLPVLDSVAASERSWLRLVLASDGPRSEHVDFVREHRLTDFAYVLSMELGLAFGVAQLPYAVLIDEAGVVRAAGLVNSREHLESLFEARERGAGSLQDYLARQDNERRVA
jgi:methylamine dehydrogenase accessory protein MauD